MATVIEQTLNGVPIYGIRDLKGVELNAQFGLNAQASVNIDKWVFSNNQRSANSDMVRLAHDTIPTEGALFSVEVTDGTDSFPFDFILDYNKYNLLAPNETEVGLKLHKSIDSLLDLQGEDITMLLLETEGFLATADYVNHPYVVENRKTILEKMQVLAQFAFASKALGDEVFKVLAILTDISTLIGAPAAAINTIATIANLIALSLQIKNLIEQIRANFFPPIKYHSAIKLKTFITKACEYLNYEVDFGTWAEDIVLIPSKYDEIGFEAPITTATQSGILSPSNFGYNLKDAFELARKLANIELSVIGDVLHCRPKNDPFWLATSGYIMPSVLVEQSPFTQNGTRRYNREDFNAARITEYITDDSDYWTIQNFATDSNGDRISVASVAPITVTDTKNININGIVTNTIPYALAVRKDLINDLVDSFNELGGAFAAFISVIELKYGSAEAALEQTLPGLAGLDAFTFNRDGALRVENDFFSRPKISILEIDSLGRARIPEDFNESIGARALYEKYFTWDSLVPGVRNPDDINDTNGKLIYENVEFGFNISDFYNVLDKGYFTTESGEIGRFTSLKWNIDKDRATASYWIQNNWAINTKETIS